MAGSVPSESLSSLELEQLIACHECDLLMRKPSAGAGERVECPRCGYELYTHRHQMLRRSMALVIAALLLGTVETAGKYYTSQWGSLPFFLAMGALLTKEVNPSFARVMRPWVLGAWVLLTFGITAGSYWAYYELGWGGWWFWDPVENASLMPWLAATALMHSVAVLAARDALRTWTIMLGVLAFSGWHHIRALVERGDATLISNLAELDKFLKLNSGKDVSADRTRADYYYAKPASEAELWAAIKIAE